MMWTCLACGETFSPMVGHDCTPPQPPTGDLVALMNRLEMLARENEKLRIRLDILQAKKEIGK